MKIRYCFALTVILIILFSLTSVVAGENMSGCASVLDDSMAVDVDGQSQVWDVSNELILENSNANGVMSAGDDKNDVDVSVWADVKNAYKGDKFNCEGCEVPWNITVKVDDGTARNVKVHAQLSANMAYLTHNVTLGVFNSTSGIWNIGDLKSSDEALLTITTKLLADGRFTLIVEATSDSNDIDDSNNFFRIPLTTGSTGSNSNTTQTSDDKVNMHSDDHFQSHKNDFVDRINEKSDDGSNKGSTDSNRDKSEDNPKKDSDSKSDDDHDSKSKSSSVTIKRNSLSKSTEPVVDALGNSIRGVIDSFSEADENNSENPSKDISKSILPYDYTRVPLIIFSVFIVLLLCIAAYGKVKS